MTDTLTQADYYYNQELAATPPTPRPSSIRQVRCTSCNRPTGEAFDANEGAAPARRCNGCSMVVGIDPMQENPFEDDPDHDHNWCCGDPALTVSVNARVYYGGHFDDGEVYIGDHEDTEEYGTPEYECAHCGAMGSASF